jgi:DNA-binding CsgD family transcriptional regulator
VLIERGLNEEAASTLNALPPLVDGPEASVVLYSRSELALATGRPADALTFLGELTRVSPSSSVAAARRGRGWLLLRAEALAALGHLEEANTLAEAELERERDWGAPRSLALAFRVAALAAPPERQLELLAEARAVIEESPALLERAHVLRAFGAATRRAGRRVEARKLLREGLELAHVCGAAPLERSIRDELIAAGGRPRRVRLSGADALTPSEARIARLAANERTNREIAQELFVTLKTVEMHLASCYRKLGISSRAQLAGALAPESQS